MSKNKKILLFLFLVIATTIISFALIFAHINDNDICNIKIDKTPQPIIKLFINTASLFNKEIYCEKLGIETNKLIVELNFCQKDNDCLTFDPFVNCPFGQYWLLNNSFTEQNEIYQKKIMPAIKKYEQKCPECVYGPALKPEAIKCVNEKCVAVFTASSDEKSCANDTDCAIKYNVKYNGVCSAGCFNIKTEVDKECNGKMFWELIPGDCVCKNNKCQLK